MVTALTGKHSGKLGHRSEKISQPGLPPAADKKVSEKRIYSGMVVGRKISRQFQNFFLTICKVSIIENICFSRWKNDRQQNSKFYHKG